MMIKKLLKILLSVFGVLYPLVVFFLLKHGLLIYVAIFLLLIILGRLFIDGKRSLRESLPLAVLGGALVILFIVTKEEKFLLLYPVIVNLVFLSVFYLSLKTIPIVEKFASLHVPLEKQTTSFKEYTRNVTKAWCIFFIINGTLALITTLCGNHDIWVLYNGFIAYILISIMFVGEYIIRRFIKKV